MRYWAYSLFFLLHIVVIIHGKQTRKIKTFDSAKVRPPKKSHKVIDSETITIPHSYIQPRSSNQELYVKLLNDPHLSILFCIGPAGTGKTLFACNTAVQELNAGMIQKIILTRPIVSVDEDLGFLPGNIISKMDPWTRPIFDVLREFYSQKEIDSMLYNGVIEIAPLAFMRGRTFKDAFIIADEMQNSSPNQMKTLTTRIGDRSKMVITGDLQQSDRNGVNGLSDLIQRIGSYKGKNGDNQIHIVEMAEQDIERSPVVRKILDIYDNKKEPTSRPTSDQKTPTSDQKTTPIIKQSVAIKNDSAMIPDDPLIRQKYL